MDDFVGEKCTNLIWNRIDLFNVNFEKKNSPKMETILKFLLFLQSWIFWRRDLINLLANSTSIDSFLSRLFNLEKNNLATIESFSNHYLRKGHYHPKVFNQKLRFCHVKRLNWNVNLKTRCRDLIKFFQLRIRLFRDVKKLWYTRDQAILSISQTKSIFIFILLEPNQFLLRTKRSVRWLRRIVRT